MRVEIGATPKKVILLLRSFVLSEPSSVHSSSSFCSSQPVAAPEQSRRQPHLVPSQLSFFGEAHTSIGTLSVLGLLKRPSSRHGTWHELLFFGFCRGQETSNCLSVFSALLTAATARLMSMLGGRRFDKESGLVLLVVLASFSPSALIGFSRGNLFFSLKQRRAQRDEELLTWPAKCFFARSGC